MPDVAFKRICYVEIIILSHFYIPMEVTNLLYTYSGCSARCSVRTEVGRELYMDSRCHARRSIWMEVVRVLYMESRRHVRYSVRTEFAKVLGVDSRHHARCPAQTEVVNVVCMNSIRTIRCYVWTMVGNVLCVDSGRYARGSVPMEILCTNYKRCVECILMVNCFLQYVSIRTMLLMRRCIATQIFFSSDAAVTYGDCRRQSGVESVRSCGQPKNSESNVVPCEKERICNTNMELWREPGRSIDRRWLLQVLPPTIHTGSACTHRNLSLNGHYGCSIRPLAVMSQKWWNAALKVLEYSAIGYRNEKTRGAQIRYWKCQNEGVAVCLY